MQYFRCKCGKTEFWGSGMSPKDCQGCKECGTTLADHPGQHKAPIPHEWVPQFNQNTGKRESDMCKNCFSKRIKEEGIPFGE